MQGWGGLRQKRRRPALQVAVTGVTVIVRTQGCRAGSLTRSRRARDENRPSFLFRWSPNPSIWTKPPVRRHYPSPPRITHLSTSTARNGVRGAVQVHAPAWIRNSPSPHTLLSPLAIIRSVPCRLSATPNPPPSRFRPGSENLLNSLSSFTG
jgi:hypothetical protein